MSIQDEKIQNLEDRIRRIEDFLNAFHPYSSISDPDILLEKAKKIVIEYDKASASLLQRRLEIGYARAARLLDQLEEIGVVGPGMGARPRDVIKK
jgi:S-DNA-T family DNA segregation ATPase FtsK/SpoIIIE